MKVICQKTQKPPAHIERKHSMRQATKPPQKAVSTGFYKNPESMK